MMGVGAASSLAGGVVGAKGAQAGAAEAQRGAEVAAQGALFTGQANRDANYFNAGQYDFQALIDERNREIALAQAVSDTRDTRRKSAAVNGQIRAAYGANGLALEGSPLDVLMAGFVEQELDVEKILYQGEIVAAGLTDQAAQARAQASMLRVTGDNALIAARYQASSSRAAGASARSIGDMQSAAALIGGVGGAARSYTVPTGRA
jgi:hypothetical protein